ncbi:hypothetical protein O6H91_15G053300 [Diphasiastrum complanatum]|uniref:Uncharacterized protein n=2 Tax=Diphasiastrum complanatum TaxID=34168 RepID=A0ACC2BIA5_DIPCM|nr:hypothetical protein O6H91_15G053300 [Diphasiastrum complanatum]
MGGALIHPRSSGILSRRLGGGAESGKRWRLCAEHHEEQSQVFPGLPDELACQILARTPRSFHSSLKLVCKAWNQALSSRELYDIRKELNLTEEWLYILMRGADEEAHWYAVDPDSGRWKILPDMPQSMENEEPHRIGVSWGLWSALGNSGVKLSSILKGWFNRRDSFEKVPYCGCSAVAMSGCLYVLGGFFRASSLKCMWRYDARTNEWTESASLGTARAYCKTGMLNNKLYAVGGVSRADAGLLPLQSAEVYDPTANYWIPIANMPFLHAQVLPTLFWADMLKPIATGLVPYQGKLCVPQSLYSWPFFLDVGGEVYDPASNLWSEMAHGMGEGWPSRKAGMKLSAVVNEQLFALDPSNSIDGNKVRMYDTEKDVWKVVHKNVPVLLDLTEAESPYLLAGFKDKLYIVTKDVSDNIAVLRADLSQLLPSGTNIQSSENEGWTTLSSRKFGPAELVACQVLDL